MGGSGIHKIQLVQEIDAEKAIPDYRYKIYYKAL